MTCNPGRPPIHLKPGPGEEDGKHVKKKARRKRHRPGKSHIVDIFDEPDKRADDRGGV
jgi:hypothetical protein